MAEVLLREFLGELAKRRFDWAETNCFTVCADWVLRATGRDPAASWRGIVKSQTDALALVKQQGGVLAFADRAMSAVGAVRVASPGPGDVAVVRTPIGKRKSGGVIWRPTTAISVDGKCFAILTLDMGLVIVPLKCLRAWRVLHVE